MCFIPNSAVWEAIATNDDAPQDLRQAAFDQIHSIAAVQSAVNSASVVGDAPTQGNKDFTCTIYSLQNKDFKEDMSDEQWAAVTNFDAITTFPGVKMADSKGFVAKAKDGSEDIYVKQTYEAYRNVYNFYKAIFGRNSLDNQGLEIRASIHLKRGYNNAFWSDSLGQMCFGDGGRWDGRGWMPPTEKELNDPAEFKARKIGSLTNWHAYYALDIVGHELTHGVVSYTARLADQQWADGDTNGWTPARNAAYSEAATLNEHIADCFGMMVKHYTAKTAVDTASWDLGTNYFSDYAMEANKWNQNVVRSFKVPDANTKSADASRPKHWNNKLAFEGTKAPGLDPHINCGIASNAFYLAALAFKGNSWDKMGTIWYNALLDPSLRDPKNQTFLGWRNLTVSYAGRIFGVSGKTNMTSAWGQVGL